MIVDIMTNRKGSPAERDCLATDCRQTASYCAVMVGAEIIVTGLAGSITPGKVYGMKVYPYFDATMLYGVVLVLGLLTTSGTMNGNV